MTEPQGSQSAYYEKYWLDDAFGLRHCLTFAARFRVPSLLKVYGELARPVRVLDYGCGNGALTWWLSRCGFGSDIVGIDISQNGVDKANERFAGPGLRFETFDPTEPLTYLGHFDVVVCSHVLEHIEHPAQAISQMAGLSDLFLFEVPLEDCLAMNARAALERTSRTSLSDNHLQFFTQSSFQKFLQSTCMLPLRWNRYAAAPFTGNGRSPLRILQRASLWLNEDLYAWAFSSNYTVLCTVIGGTAASL